MVTKPPTIDAKAAADKVIPEVNLQHACNYLRPKSKPKGFRESISRGKQISQNQIIYSSPGKARSVELVMKDRDLRAGIYPQHNSQGFFSQDIEQLESLSFNEYKGILSPTDLEFRGFKKQTACMTQKRFYKLASQFAHMSTEAFKQMTCVYDTKQRDYDVYVRTSEVPGLTWTKTQYETAIAVFNPHFNTLQFVQILQKDVVGKVFNLKHIVFDAGEPIVVNEARLDQFGKLRQIAHVGDWGGKSEYLNSVERFDDGAILWTVTEQTQNPASASAALREDGRIEILKYRESELHYSVARNLGAEGIDGATGKWTGCYDPEAAKSEFEDKFILRRDYKASIRKQVYQIVDGAALPGLVPIFDI